MLNTNTKNIIGQIIAIFFLISVVGISIWLIIQKEKNTPPITNDAVINLTEASFYKQLDNGYVKCSLCPNRCILADKQVGLCRARQNIDGRLYSLVYGEIAAKHIDPVEKKPLYHFMPGSRTLSIATAGCNLSCKQCQNWDLSQKFPWEVESVKMTPQQVVDEALQTRSPIIAYTYSEPTIFYEFMLATAKLAHENNIKNIMHSAGYINTEPLQGLIPYLDGANIDLKAFRNEVYQELTNGTLQPVLDTLKTLREHDVWLEITYLIIPGYNDDDEQISDMISWVKDNLGSDVPIHFSRFTPMNKLTNTIPTPVDTIKKARQMALDAGLKYVYTGNVPWVEGNSTFCDDGSIAIERKGYFISKNTLTADGLCPDNTPVPGFW